ncbi:hypothetical protein [Rhodospirillum sp. A1_3_36]|uniref:hypothetical protein n=1 Tax=Rhodospirillum sp. A1_3_36 TaxID=3391666 RepID=UPI0039A75599
MHRTKPIPLNYLQIFADTPNNDQLNAQFQQYHHDLMPFFKEKPWPNWQFRIGVTRKPGELPSSNGATLDRQKYMFIFQVNDFNTLPYVHRALLDSITYKNMSELVLWETQTFASALSYNPQTIDPNFEIGSRVKYYFTMTVDLIDDQQKIIDLKNFMFNCTKDNNSQMKTDYGFTLAHATFGQTGVMRRLYFTWVTTSKSPEPEKAAIWFENQAAVRAVLNAPLEWSLWSPMDLSMS